MAVLEESPLKVKVPAQPAANRKDFSSKPRPSRGSNASLSSESEYVPFKALGKVIALVAGQPSAVLFCPSWAAVGRVGRVGGAGEAPVGSKVTARTTWAGDSVLPAAAAASRALGLVARRAARTAEPDAGSRRHGHQDGRVAGGRPG